MAPAGLAGALQSHAAAGADVDSAGFFASSFTLDNYVTVFGSAAQLGRGIVNSAIVALLTTALAIILGAPAAYALARLQVPRADAILLMVLAAQMFPAIVIVIPLFIAASKLGIDRHKAQSHPGLSVVQSADGDLGAARLFCGPSRGPRARRAHGRRIDRSDVSHDHPADLAAAAVRRGDLCLHRGVERVLLRAHHDAPGVADGADRHFVFRRPVSDGLRTDDGSGGHFGGARHSSWPSCFATPFCAALPTAC